MNFNTEQEREIITAIKDFAKSINSNKKVYANMSNLIGVTSQLPLSNLNHWEGLIRNQFSSRLENTVQPKWKFWSKPVPFLTWCDLCSCDGHKREKTLRSLTGGAPNSFFFAIAVRRLNDWVPQVREAARETLRDMAKASEPTHIADALCITLINWSSWGRVEDQDKKVLLDIVSTEKVSLELKSKIISSTSGPMTSIMSQVCRTTALDQHLSEIASNAIQPSVRAKAYRTQLEGKVIWVEGKKWEWIDIKYCKGELKPIISERELTEKFEFITTLKQAAIDRSPMVRRIATEILIRELGSIGDISEDLASHFASDSSPSVAERGQFALKKLKA